LRLILDDRERAFACRLRSTRERARYVAAHVALRDILGRYCAVSPAAIRFDRSTRGRPVVGAPATARGLHFSLSRSGAIAVVAIARGRVMGVDVEQRGGAADVDMDAVGGAFFPDGERAALAAAEPAARPDAFLRLWTRREAALKARGLGLPDGVGPDGRFVAVGDDLVVIELRPTHGSIAALAVEPPRPTVTLLSWRPQD
jgi:4'-phosphopantetheinyl transferase